MFEFMLTIYADIVGVRFFCLPTLIVNVRREHVNRRDTLVSPSPVSDEMANN